MFGLVRQGLRKLPTAVPLHRAPALRCFSVTPLAPSGDSFLSGSNSVYAEEMYRAYKADPESVHASWRAFFSQVDNGVAPGDAFASPGGSSGFSAPSGETSLLLRVLNLVRTYQVRGHQRAKIDPLSLWDPLKFGAYDHAPELDAAKKSFSKEELNQPVRLAGDNTTDGFLSEAVANKLTVGELIERLETVYCGTVGYEYMHIANRAQCNWIRQRIETLEDTPVSKAEKMHILDRMCWAETLETFFAKKYSTAKRFGLEGCESLIAGTKALLDTAVSNGVTDVVLGMPHRGRINVLANVMRKDLELIFKEFDESHVDMEDIDDWSGSGDVKYHLGTSSNRRYPDGSELHLSLLANPSHLEAVNPLVLGKVRAKQDALMGTTIASTSKYTSNVDQWGRVKEGAVPDHTKKVLGLQLHGDAAYAGQGVVYESMMLSHLADFETGGTVHVVCNNQVGFTTNPEAGRSTLYCTDIGKTFSIPVFHVNADDPEAVTRVFKMAAEYRQKWHTDVIVDLVGYRRWGHNELDMPKFTQPIMYKAIDERPTALELYKKQLLDEGSLTEDEIKEIQANVDTVLTETYDRSKTSELKEEWKASMSEPWKDMYTARKQSPRQMTGLPRSELEEIASILTAVPEGMKLHPGISRVMKARKAALSSGENLDWACGEALAFASICRDGKRVRLSGQDVERGTFSHRHAILHDQETGQRFCAFDKLGDSSAPFTIANSSLSEFGVLGFETGYSLESPEQLVMWEAQFGDFVNGAQIIIDQFISSGEAKWGRQCGITLLLPHGFEGQGPEHSSCRVERFLQSCDDPEDCVPETTEDGDPVDQIQRSNWQVVVPTTPANYFHALRRQVKRRFRKPLIVVNPKSLLRLKDASSTFEDVSEGTYFKRVLDDPAFADADSGDVKRVVMCSGKVYYDLAKAREADGANDVALVRVEQLAPFPHDAVASVLSKYPSSAELVWCQEEPANMGAWTFVAPRISNGTGREPRYAGRPAAAAPAVGLKKLHDKEQNKLVHTALHE